MTSDNESFAWRADGSNPVAAAARRALLTRVHPAPRMHQILQSMLVEQQPGASWDGASVFLALPDDVTIASALSSTVTTADELQLRLDEGPALESMAGGTDLLVDDTACDFRWPRWAAGMAAQGWRSVLTRSVGCGAHRAALTLYSRHPESFTLTAQSAADQFAARARSAVTAALAVLRLTPSGEPESMLSRAQTLLMGRYGASGYDALELMCVRADNPRVGIPTIAKNILRGNHGLA